MDSVRAYAPSESSPVDVDDLLRRCLGRIDLAERILQTFQSSLEKDIQQLEEAVLATQADEIAHIAHRIKGASLAVSAYELTDCARSIEQSAAAHCLENIPDHLARLKQESSRFVDLPSLVAKNTSDSTGEKN